MVPAWTPPATTFTTMGPLAIGKGRGKEGRLCVGRDIGSDFKRIVAEEQHCQRFSFSLLTQAKPGGQEEPKHSTGRRFMSTRGREPAGQPVYTSPAVIFLL